MSSDDELDSLDVMYARAIEPYMYEPLASGGSHRKCETAYDESDSEIDEDALAELQDLTAPARFWTILTARYRTYSRHG